MQVFPNKKSNRGFRLLEYVAFRVETQENNVF